MSFLLDTHTLIWALLAPDLLSKRATDRLSDPDVVVSVTVVSLWEISLKYAIGKLQLTGVTPDDLPQIVTQCGIYGWKPGSFHPAFPDGHQVINRCLTGPLSQRGLIQSTALSTFKHLPDFGCQILHRKGLLNEFYLRVKKPLMRYHIGGVTGHEKALQVRVRG